MRKIDALPTVTVTQLDIDQACAERNRCASGTPQVWERRRTMPEIVNVTLHPIIFRYGNGEEFTAQPSGFVINATIAEEVAEERVFCRSCGLPRWEGEGDAPERTCKTWSSGVGYKVYTTCNQLNERTLTNIEEYIDIVKASYLPNDEGKEILRRFDSLEFWRCTECGAAVSDHEFHHHGCKCARFVPIDEHAIIVGSVIAAQAYPGRVFGLVAVPGYERVPVAEKRMDPTKFVSF